MGRHQTLSGVRPAALAFAMALFFLSKLACASTITFYTDRALWEADALAAGLLVATEDFSVEPSTFPNLTVGGINFTVNARAGAYDSVNQRAGFASGGGRTLGIDYTGGADGLFGFGVDKPLTLGLFRVTDIENTADSSSATDEFIGMLGTVALDPSNPVHTDAAEYFTSGLGAGVWIDNLSVAVIPLPPAVFLMLSGLAGLGFLAGRRKMAKD